MHTSFDSCSNVSVDSRVVALQAAISEHQATIREYSEENRRLEEQVAQLKARQPTELASTSVQTTDLTTQTFATSCTETCLRGFDRCHPVEGRPSSPSHRRPQ
jgi:hypothetical protein